MLTAFVRSSFVGRWPRMACAIEKPSSELSGEATKDMSFKCWFPDQTTQVVLENPSSTAANARIIFHLDQPSRITGTDRLSCSYLEKIL